jgi:hypothetical protein
MSMWRFSTKLGTIDVRPDGPPLDISHGGPTMHLRRCSGRSLGFELFAESESLLLVR